MPAFNRFQCLPADNFFDPIFNPPNSCDIYGMDNDTHIYLQFLQKTLLPMPGVSEKLCFGTPAFYVNKKIFARMKEDGETLVVQSIIREKWLLKDPETFFITDHYLNYDYMLVNLKKVSPEELSGLLITAWHNRAPRKLALQFKSIADE